MNVKPYLPHLVVLGMLAASALSLRHAADLSTVIEPAVRSSLPERVGEWIGEEMSYCQNESCLRAIPLRELDGRQVCPVCGGKMALSWSLPERQLLPADTVLARKLYRSATHPPLLVTIVINSSEEVSIHRPEMCLTGQGYDIAGEQTRAIAIPGRPPLRVHVMDLFSRRQVAGARLIETPMFYAYWFTSRSRETPSSVWRIVDATWQRVVFGRVYRWAYVAVSGDRIAHSDESQRQYQAFIRDLYPLIMKGGRE